MLIRLKNRKGTIPRLSPRLLQPEYAQVAENCKLWQREISPISGPRLVEALFHGLNCLTIYRYKATATTGYWFNWDKVVHVAKGAVANDTIRRVYYTGALDDVATTVRPKKTSLDIAGAAQGAEMPADWYWMGVETPLEKPYLVSDAGGAGEAADTYYLFTYITAWGEESAPSPPSALVSRLEGDDITVRKGPATDATTAKTFTADVTNDEIDLTGHNIGDFSVVQLSTTGTLDSPLSPATDYYMVPVNDNAFSLALSLDDALRGRVIDITGGGSGTHSITQTGLDPRFNITGWRVYRTLTGATATDFQLVNTAADVGIATQTYSDTTLNIDLGEALAAYDYNEPPDDLEGVTEHPGGFTVGFSNVEHKVCMSEPFFPHAFPDTANNRKTVDGEIVAVKVIGTAIIVLKADAKPEVLIGVAPATMTPTTMDARQMCLEARSALESPFGVLFSSPDGMYQMRPGSGVILTRELYSKDEWDGVRPETHRTEVYDGRIYVSYDSDGFGTRKMLIIDPNEPDAGVITVDLDVDTLHTGIITDGLFLVIGGELFAWDSDAASPMQYTYRSGKIPLAAKKNFGAAQLKGDFTLSGIIGGSLSFDEYAALRLELIAWNEATRDLTAALPFHWPHPFGGKPFGATAFGMPDVIGVPAEIGDGVTFRLYVNGVLKHTEVVTSELPFGLTTGYRGDELEIEVEGKVALEEILVATSKSALRRG